MADAGGGRALRWTGIAEGLPSDLAEGGEPRTVARNVARCHRAAASSALQARRHAARAGIAEQRARTASQLGIGAGCAGICCVAATLIPGLIPYRFVIDASLSGMVFGGFPVAVLVARAARWTRAEDQVGPSTLSAKARALSKFSADLGQMFVDLGDKPDPASLRAADALLDLLEADVAALSRDGADQNGPAPTKRRHKRILPRHRRVIVKTGDGRNLVGTIANLSVSGVALSGRLPRLEIGDKVVIGRQQAIVARQSDRSTVLQFRSALDPSTFGVDTVL